jgi:hypothetical protein
MGYLDGQKHPAAAVAAVVLWAGVAAIGVAATAIAFVADKDGALRLSGALEMWLDRLLAGGIVVVSRFIFEPVGAITERLDDWVPAADGGLARAAAASGRIAIAAARVPAVPLVVLIAVLLALAVGLAAPGVFR